MNVVLLLVLVCGYYGILCAENSADGRDKQPTTQQDLKAKDAALNFLEPNAAEVETLIKKPYKVHNTFYFAKPGYRIVSLLDGTTPIWKHDGCECDYIVVVRKKEKKCCKHNLVPRLILIQLNGPGGKKSRLFFGKPDSTWEAIGEDKFFDTFHNIVTWRSTLTWVVLSLNGYNSPYYFYVTNTPEFPFLVFAPNVGYRVTKVIWEKKCKVRRDDSMYYFWRSKSKTKNCIYASFYPRENHKVGYLIIDTPKKGIMEKYYVRNNGMGWAWKEVKKEEYLKKLKEAGFNPATFTNEITMDVNKPTETHYYKHVYDSQGSDMTLYTVYPGLRLARIVDKDLTIWESSSVDEDYCVFFSIFTSKGSPRSFYMFATDPKHNREVLYFAKKADGTWIRVDKHAYYYMFSNPDPSVYTHKNSNVTDDKGNRKMIMSSFKNRDGLKIATYASTVENPKGDVILIHGVRSYFISEFGTVSLEWNYKNLDFPLFPDVHKFDKETFLFNGDLSHGLSNAKTYKDVFDYVPFEGQNVFELTPRCEYVGSGIKYLNDIGYNVYSYDLQSHGFSEGFSPNRRCHVNAYNDYHFDAIQFTSIVKRGKFSDHSEKWDENLVFSDVRPRRKTFFWGNSMGGNINMRAVQEFHKKAKNPDDRLVDGLISTSGMLNIDTNLDCWYKQWGMSIISIQTWLHPNKIDYYQPFIDYGESFDLFLRYRDPMFFFKKTTFRSLYALFEGAWDVNKEENLKYYPKDLPTIFFNSKKDTICSIVGQYNMMERYLTGETTKLVAYEGTTHYLAVPQVLVNSAPFFASFLEEYGKEKEEKT